MGMNSKLAVLTALTTLFVVGCDTPQGGDDSMGGDGGIDITATGGMDDGSESDGDGNDGDGNDGDGNDSDGDTNDFPDTGDGDDSDGFVPTCGGESVVLSTSQPSVMLLLDKSGSMTSNAWDHDGDGSTATINRWTSLFDVTSDLLDTYASTVHFGAVLFPALDAQVLNTNDYDAQFAAACRMSDTAEVAVGADTREAILAALPGRTDETEGATPTREAVLNGLEHLENEVGDGPKAMILVTDGAANCVYQPGSNLARVYDTELEGTVRSAFVDHGIPTYVVGIDITAEHPAPGRNLRDDLNAVADAGGVAREGDERFYNVADEDTLAAALDEIAQRVECTIALTHVPDSGELFSVEIDGASVSQVDSCEDGDGWRFATEDRSSIELCNAACGAFTDVQQLDTSIACMPEG